jgi:hypothetical protein
MKCIRCGKQNDYRTRQAHGGACAGCSTPFAFEPRNGDPITDLAFRNAISTVSDDGRLAWLERQLYYEVARRVRRRRPLHRLLRRRIVSLDDQTFATLLARWSRAHGAPAGVLRRNAFAVDVRAGDRARDAAAYGFDRLLVCGSEEIVDVLLANGFHGDYKCALLAASGYPSWAYELIVPRLRASPPSALFVVHDADTAGCRLADDVTNGARWFRGGGVEVRDAGLRPGDAARFRGSYLAASGTSDLLATHTTVDEARWLAKHRLELAAVRPRALLQILGQAVTGRADDVGPRATGMPFVFAWGDGAGDSGGHGDGGGDG